MPKIRCTSCDKVLNVPDQARGKTVACPQCHSKIKVPAGGSKQKAAKPKRPDSQPSLASIDLSRLQEEDEDNPICPYCAAEMDEDDPVCRSCGMNVETGQMDRREARKRAMRGPDPALYFKNAWSGSWQFLMENKGLAVRTGTYWALFATINAVCAYMGLVYCQRFETRTFWSGLMVVSGMGIPGWYMFLGLKVIGATMTKDQVRGDRIHFDFFQSVAAGFRICFWPFIVMGPFTPLFLAIFFITGISWTSLFVLIFGGLVFVLVPIMVLPSAMVHMTANYTYKAWILWELLKCLVKVIPGTLFFYLLAFAAFLPVLVVALPIMFVLQSGNPVMSPTMNNLTGNITLWIMGIAELRGGEESFTFTAIRGVLNVFGTYICLAPIAYAAGFPAVFVMKLNGLFGYYNSEGLDPIYRIYPGTPATFWVRYLAHTIDNLFIPLTGVLVFSNKVALMVQWGIIVVSFLIAIYLPVPWLKYGVVPLLLPLYTSWMFWSVQESSEMRSTIGKDAFGLQVITDNEKTLTLKRASGRWILRVLFYFPLFIPYLIAIFHPEKRTLHDLATQTRVVWKGDK